MFVNSASRPFNTCLSLGVSTYCNAFTSSSESRLSSGPAPVKFAKNLITWHVNRKLENGGTRHHVLRSNPLPYTFFLKGF